MKDTNRRIEVLIRSTGAHKQFLSIQSQNHGTQSRRTPKVARVVQSRETGFRVIPNLKSHRAVQVDLTVEADQLT